MNYGLLRDISFLSLPLIIISSFYTLSNFYPFTQKMINDKGYFDIVSPPAW